MGIYMVARFGLFVHEDQSRLPTLYWLPKPYKIPYKSQMFADSSLCSTTELSIIILTFCITVIHVVKYFETVYERIGKKLIWFGTKSGNIFNKLKSKCFLASSMSTNDYSLYLFASYYNQL